VEALEMAALGAGRWTRWLQLGLSLYATAIFAGAWIGFSVLESQTLDRSWQWLTGLPILPQVLTWILILPAGFALWIRQAELTPAWEVAAIGLFVVWTLLAARSLFQAVRAG
jgi:hypothetical protein